MTWVWIFALVVLSAPVVGQRESDEQVVVRSTKDVGYFENLEDCMQAASALTAMIDKHRDTAACVVRFNV